MNSVFQLESILEISILTIATALELMSLGLFVSEHRNKLKPKLQCNKLLDNNYFVQKQWTDKNLEKFCDKGTGLGDVVKKDFAFTKSVLTSYCDTSKQNFFEY